MPESTINIDEKEKEPQSKRQTGPDIRLCQLLPIEEQVKEIHRGRGKTQTGKQRKRLQVKRVGTQRVNRVI